jgi:hypothetical protein
MVSYQSEVSTQSCPPRYPNALCAEIIKIICSAPPSSMVFQVYTPAIRAAE